jgi:serine/threonine-protein kinase
MGTVYKAVHTLMDKPVAVKVLKGDLAGEPEAIARFHREARSASRLDHEHCIRVTDFGASDDGLLFLVMELLEGESLSALLKSAGALEEKRAATFGVAIAAALTHAHELGIIHRDLKPDNVFLARRGNRSIVKVLDFGLAKIAGDLASGGPSITKAGVVFGTPEYMAPEQAEGAGIDARSDLYGLGVVLYHMLTGDIPFRAPSFLALLSKHVEELPEPLHLRRPDLPMNPALEAVVMKLLEKDPNARYQTAQEVVEALTPFAEMPVRSGPLSTAEVTDPGLAVPSGPRAVAASSGPSEMSRELAEMAGPSVMSGEVVLRPKRSLGKGLALGLVALALVGGGVVGGVTLLRHHPSEPIPITPQKVEEPAKDALTVARGMLDLEDLDGAEEVLTKERAAHNSAALQIVLGDLEIKRSNRLGAQTHYFLATRLAPDEAEPHARLASYLAVVLGQREAACKEAKLALARDGKNAVARSVASRCPGLKVP